MTIGEHLERQVRAYNRLKWAVVLAVVITALMETFSKRSNTETYVWMAAIGAPLFLAAIVFGRRVKCPRCQKSLFKELAHSTPTRFTVLSTATKELSGRESLTLEACPQCGCKFSEPYVGG